MYNFTPKSTNDMVFSNTTSKTLIHNILKGDLPFPRNGVSGLLFYGVYGTRKTTYADVFCNELKLKKVSSKELQMSSPPIVG